MQITELHAKNEKLLDIYLENKITKEQFTERSLKIEKEMEQKQMLLSNEKERISNRPEINIEKIKEKIKIFDNLELYEKRLLLKAVINKITILPDDLKIELNVM